MADSDHNVNIKINANPAPAVGAFGRVINSLTAVKAAANRIMEAFGVFGMAVHGINAVISGYKWLKEKIEETEKAAARLRDELERQNIADRIAREAASYEKLNKAIAETARLEKERNDILNGRRLSERSIEDAKAERDKQNEIGRIDADDADYEAKKADIERRYQLEANERNRARAGEDTRTAAAELYGQANAREGEANRLEGELSEAVKTVRKAWGKRMETLLAAQGGDEGAVARREKDNKAYEDAVRAAQKIREAMEAARKEAQTLRSRAGEMAGGNLAANLKAEAEYKRLTGEAKRKNAQDLKAQIEENDKKLAEGKAERQRREQTVEDAKLARQKAEDIAALDPKSKTYDREKREIEMTYETKAAENKVARAKTEADRQAARLELETLVINHGMERRAFEQGNAAELDAFSARVAGVSGVSQNRLTAMGLGSGVTAGGSVQSDVKKLVGLMEKQIAATKENKPGASEGVAVYGE